MEYVEPIKDGYKIDAIKKYLKKRNERDYILFMVGIHTGLLLTDLLGLKVEHIMEKEIRIKDRHTGHLIRMPLHHDLKSALLEYTKDKGDHEYLFKSREGINTPIDRNRAYKIIKALEAPFGLESTGASTLRKTFGYHYYKATGDADTLKRMFNHAHPSSTLRYIGIIDRDVSQAYLNINFSRQ